MTGGGRRQRGKRIENIAQLQVQIVCNENSRLEASLAIYSNHAYVGGYRDGVELLTVTGLSRLDTYQAIQMFMYYG